jgi:hypothetical protein
MNLLPPWYKWNIVESGIKHHNPYTNHTYICPVTVAIDCPLISNQAKEKNSTNILEKKRIGKKAKHFLFFY